MIYTSYFLKKTVTTNDFQKLQIRLKNSKNKINPGRPPPVNHLSAPSISQITAFFAHFAANRIRTHDHPLTRYSSNHYTSHLLVSIIDFLSPHTILN